jgi:4-hydroxy-4-methyl-2-oxoglutarate aldolase
MEESERAKSHDAVDALKDISSGMIVDALAMAGLEGAVPGILPARGFEGSKIVGPAATVLFGPADPHGPKLSMYRAIRDSQPGSILIVDGKGQGGHFTGDNQGECARRHGLLGMVVHGGARDIAGYRGMAMPLWCMGPATADKPRGFAVVAHNIPVEIAGVRVKPGDIIVADEDGVVVIAHENLGTVLDNLKVIIDVENGMEKALQRDASVEELEAIIRKKRRKG